MTPADLTAKLDHLKASATKEYSLKNYAAAAEHYSEAAEVQDQLNGEMVPENADLLYQYGRCLYHVAVAKSDVLGGKVAGAGGEEPKRKKRKVGGADGGESSAAGASAEGSAGGVIGAAMQTATGTEADGAGSKQEGKPQSNSISNNNNPYFQITGDENWTDSEDSADDDDDAANDPAADAEADEEEDDFATAYEILDMARVLLTRQLTPLESASASTSATAAAAEPAEVRQLKERLADTHDLQAEISLENERFTDAVGDTRAALGLKRALYPPESSLVAEAHFKLSLALEFASVTSAGGGGEGGAQEEEEEVQEGEGRGEAKPAQVDESLRREAAAEMEKAIASCRLRISKEEASLAAVAGSGPPATALDDRRRGIADVKEMVADMEQRLGELRNPAAAAAAGASLAAGGAGEGEEALRGVLGAMLGESRGERERRLQEATRGATDLSGLVKKGKGKGKRKAEEGEGEGVGGVKKARSEDPAA